MLATIYDSPIYQTIYALMDSVPFVYVNATLCIILIAVFALYAFSREGRDEHGRAIIGSACLWGLLALFILMNLFGQFTWTILSSPYVFTNAYRLVFNLYMIVVLVAIAILRKVR